MIDSPHLARWLDQFKDEGLCIRLFPSTPNRMIHPRITELALDRSLLSEISYPKVIARWLWLLLIPDLLCGGRVRRLLLQRELMSFSPDVVHGIEMQHGAYLALDAMKLVYRGQKRPTFVVTNYGSDIFWFQHFKRHLKKIRDVLNCTDLYLTECTRDIVLARDHGYTGRALWCGPNGGGFDFESSSLKNISLDISKRQLIVVKGYTAFVGRAQVPIRVLRRMQLPPDISVLVYSANLKARIMVQFARSSGTNIVARPKRYFTHDEMLQIFSQARIYIGHSLSDGISTSFLEALATGAYPIQTDTACVSEWADKGFVFSSVEALNDSQLEAAISLCLSSPGLLEQQIRLNRKLAEQHLSKESVFSKNQRIYSSD
jgi:hypothetical protein